jgi:hypothetical protein
LPRCLFPSHDYYLEANNIPVFEQWFRNQLIDFKFFSKSAHVSGTVESFHRLEQLNNTPNYD